MRRNSLIYSYGRSFNGFAAKLSDEEVVTFSGDIFMRVFSTDNMIVFFC